ncbi:hypothetical protein CH253_17075 [Rhodococcus sp. 06-156-3C]|nr:hypothetical protein CH253_17075 [Rhodococcus sp. 06-156-3C]OZD34109.1 hypothetical protein CH247_08485 [Rhodococcus sp. 06-156-3b]
MAVAAAEKRTTMTEGTTLASPIDTDTVVRLARRVDALEGELAVRRLQHQYGYYLDKCLYSEVVDLFSKEAEVVFIGGIYRGRAGIERLYLQRFRERFTQGYNGPVRGFLLDHLQLQDVVTVDPDGASAHARFRCVMQAGVHESVRAEFPGKTAFEQWWEGGVYENEYVREDGIWKIKRLDYRPTWHADYAKGWSETAPLTQVVPTATYPEDPIGPDEIAAGVFETFPNTEVVGFHYAHPVTDKAWRA